MEIYNRSMAPEDSWARVLSFILEFFIVWFWFVKVMYNRLIVDLCNREIFYLPACPIIF